MTDSEGHPVIAGLAALAGVGVVVGLLVSGGALAASSVLGLDGEDDGGTTSSQQSMYLPRPSSTESSSGPLVTLAPGAETTAAVPTAPPTPEFVISLSSAETAVGQMDEIHLTGTYPTGEGAIVQVQRLENDVWTDFASVDASVSGGTFSTYVITARTGDNIFRVRDTDSDQVSNEVTVAVN